MDQEVHNITNELPGHTGHAGPPSYLAYTSGKCKHRACYAAYVEYRERLVARRMSGTFKDERYAANKKPITLEDILDRLKNDPELAGQLIPVLAGTVEGVVPEQPEPVAAEATEAAPTAASPLALEAAESHAETPEPTDLASAIAALRARAPQQASAPRSAAQEQATHDAYAARVQSRQRAARTSGKWW